MLILNGKGEILLRKPISIIILSVLFFLSPLAILIVNAALNMVPLIGYGSIIFRLKIFDIIILSLYLISSLSIFLVRKWGWWVLIFSAVTMFVYNLITFFINPFSSLLILLLMNLGLFLTAIIFFRKHLIAPYFNPQLRWWKQDQRYEIDIYLKLLGINKNVIISDISEGGCYIFVDFLIDSGAVLPVLVVCGDFHISIKAKIMRIANETEQYYGYGLMFQNLNEVEKEGLRQLLNKLKAFSQFESDNIDSDEKRTSTRYFIANDLSISMDRENSPANLMDISRSGCSLLTAVEMETNHKCLFHFRVKQTIHTVPALVIWKKSDKDGRQYGLKFQDMDKPSKKALYKMISSFLRLGARKRKITKKDFYQRCEETLNETPYKVVLFLKRLFNINTG
ncbi:MAG: PilZ domain-containing protein [Spirochaetaceae bacterium]|nr:PilZ domain-containing protein [Spirochaetaceae bacterium]